MKTKNILLAAQILLIVAAIALAVWGLSLPGTSGAAQLYISLALLLGFFVVTYIRSIVKKKEVKPELKAKLKLVGGLPIAKDAMIEIHYTPQEIVFTKDNQTFKMTSGKIISVDRVSSKDTNAQIAGAAAGLFLFGAMGMAAGVLSEKYFLVISYKSDDETKFITFEEGNSAKFTKELVSRFQNDNPKANEVVEL